MFNLDQFVKTHVANHYFYFLITVGLFFTPELLAAQARLTGVYTLPRISLQTLAPTNRPPYDLATAHANGLTVTDSLSIGSGLARRADGALFGITDRGPNGSAAGDG